MFGVVRSEALVRSASVPAVLELAGSEAFGASVGTLPAGEEQAERQATAPTAMSEREVTIILESASTRLLNRAGCLAAKRAECRVDTAQGAPSIGPVAAPPNDGRLREQPSAPNLRYTVQRARAVKGRLPVP